MSILRRWIVHVSLGTVLLLAAAETRSADVARDSPHRATRRLRTEVATVDEQPRLLLEPAKSAKPQLDLSTDLTRRRDGVAPLSTSGPTEPPNREIAQVQKGAEDEPELVITPHTIRVEPLDPKREGSWIVLPGFSELGSPTFSPDGQWVAFDAYREGYNNSPSECWVAQRDGLGLRKLAVGATPRWSPDGKTLLFMRDEANDPTRKGGIFRIDRDGTHETRIRDGRWPDWSPDGKMIAFSLGGRPGGGLRTGATICTANTDGSDLREIAIGDCPSWSPDGKKLAYCVRLPGERPEIRVMDIEEHAEAVVGTGWFRANWSPDGKSLFANGLAGPDRIGMVQFTVRNHWTSDPYMPEFERPSSPCPSADGKLVVFIAKRPGAARKATK